MFSKNSEVQQCVNINWVFMLEIVCKEINMNIVVKLVYNFYGVNFILVKDVVGIWLIFVDIVKVFGYKSIKLIFNLFMQYEDEFF